MKSEPTPTPAASVMVRGSQIRHSARPRNSSAHKRLIRPKWASPARKSRPMNRKGPNPPGSIRGLSWTLMPPKSTPKRNAAAALFRAKLLAWFRRHGRDLPWRRTRDPYRILVSEVMLQQTQVARVTEYYPRFLAAFPTLGRLAAAKPERVREAWDGLGYYRRAANLHRLARE